MQQEVGNLNKLRARITLTLVEVAEQKLILTKPAVSWLLIRRKLSWTNSGKISKGHDNEDMTIFVNFL